MAKQVPVSLDVQALLLAAGIDRPTPTQVRNVRHALALYARSIAPRLLDSKERWRFRALRLRDRYAPHLDWGSSELNEDPVA